MCRDDKSVQMARPEKLSVKLTVHVHVVDAYLMIKVFCTEAAMSLLQIFKDAKSSHNFPVS